MIERGENYIFMNQNNAYQKFFLRLEENKSPAFELRRI